MKPIKVIVLFVFVLFSAKNLKANEVSLFVDSTKKDTLVSLVHSPRKATILALSLPGAGQIYNQKYWKVPVVYAALGISIYSLISNQTNMTNMNDSFSNIYAMGKTPNPLSIQQREDYRINRDASIIAVSIIYVLQVIDATVDAHFFKFDINQNLSADFHPERNRIFSLTYNIR
jgi:hypothetical protein